MPPAVSWAKLLLKAAKVAGVPGVSDGADGVTVAVAVPVVALIVPKPSNTTWIRPPSKLPAGIWNDTVPAVTFAEPRDEVAPETNWIFCIAAELKES